PRKRDHNTPNRLVNPPESPHVSVRPLGSPPPRQDLRHPLRPLERASTNDSREATSTNRHAILEIPRREQHRHTPCRSKPLRPLDYYLAKNPRRSHELHSFDARFS